MPRYHGKLGKVKIGAADVGQTSGWEITTTHPISVTRAQGEAWADANAGIPEWSGSITLWRDPADTGQQALLGGTILAFEGFPEGEGTGNSKLSGNILISESNPTSNVENDNEQTYNFTGKGALTEEILV